ncbi:MAG TPA: glutathione S-transferase [Stellaceae bacterium]|nr:glutathione S-transferase [Stellaceae bacterium]
MLRILGRPNSYNTQKVLWLLDELGTPFALELAGLEHGVNHTPEYNKLNPNELVPTLIEDDLVLWESNSILRYLAAQYGNGKLLPADLRDRARGDRWLDWALTTLAPAITPAFWGLIRSKPEQRDSARIAEAVTRTNHSLAMLDRYLGETAYVGGRDFGIGDIPIGILTYRFYSLPIERHRFSHLEAWYKRLGERPAYRQRVMIGLS